MQIATDKSEKDMSTIIYPSPIFGPVHSRRLGISLGVNLMPGDGKICTFDCVYCECGFNRDFRPKEKRPSREEVKTRLEEKLIEMQEDRKLPDVITFAGNGEPTAHPDFKLIIDDTIELRNKYCPAAKVSVLSNSTLINKQDVFEALMKVDNNILKLDTTNVDFINTVDRPTGRYNLEEITERMKDFNGHLIIQTMFLKGRTGNTNVDNTTDDYVLPWIEKVKEIKPEKVMIYTIDRETPDNGLVKATHEELDRIVALLTAEGISASASY